MLLSVVVPCFNEEGGVARFESELIPALDALGVRYELLAIDDGSTDGTLSALKALAAGHRKVHVFSHVENRGLGAALRTGFAQAQGDWTLTLDADLTFHPPQIKALLDAQKATGADLVSGSPFLGGFAGVSWRRRLPSLLLNIFYRGLFDRNFTSYTPIFRLYRSVILKALPLTSQGFEINAEIAARFLLAKRRLAEVPATLASRREGVSKLRACRELSRHMMLVAKLLSERY